MTKTGMRDPLLVTTTAVLWAALVVLALGAAALMFAVPALLTGSDAVTVRIAEQYPAFAPADMPWLVGFILLALACVALAIVIVRKLIEIVASVREGDPLTDDNAARLALMGWCALALQVAGIAIDVTKSPLLVALGIDTGNGGVDLSGVILVLLLFVLARVFRTGAAIRRDLEGTV